MEIFDRQVKAFGKELQLLLSGIHVGVVGCGGTGSAVIEQLIRLGVGMISIFDGDRLDGTNVTRVHGSGLVDSGSLKVDIMRNMANRIGLGTQVRAIPEKIVFESCARELPNCDLVFGCTDDNLGRSVLNRLSSYYYIPVLDTGVIIDSENGVIQSVVGRITRVNPGTACLLCRNRINLAKMQVELMNPAEHMQMVNDGYAPELGDNDPAVITFTTSVACQAVTEMIQLLSGFMGADRASSEVLMFFDRTKTKTNCVPPVGGCACNNPHHLGRGDSSPFMQLSWPPENGEAVESSFNK